MSEMLSALSQPKVPPAWNQISTFLSSPSLSKMPSTWNEISTLCERIAKMQELEPSPWVKSAIEVFRPSLGEFLNLDDKISAVRNYLKTEFPGYTIDDYYDFDRVTQTFRLTVKDKILLVTPSRVFIDDHSPSEISILLQGYNLSQYFKDERVARVIVTNAGVEQEYK